MVSDQQIIQQIVIGLQVLLSNVESLNIKDESLHSNVEFLEEQVTKLKQDVFSGFEKQSDEIEDSKISLEIKLEKQQEEFESFKENIVGNIQTFVGASSSVSSFKTASSNSSLYSTQHSLEERREKYNGNFGNRQACDLEEILRKANLNENQALALLGVEMKAYSTWVREAFRDNRNGIIDSLELRKFQRVATIATGMLTKRDPVKRNGVHTPVHPLWRSILDWIYIIDQAVFDPKFF